jgi:hypothetical protein
LVNHTTTGICILNVSGQVISVNCFNRRKYGGTGVSFYRKG